MSETNLDTFSSEETQMFSCRFETYRLGHSELYVRVSNNSGDLVYYLLFSGVEFVSCPTQWVGANFEVGTEKECKQVLQILEMDNQMLEYIVSKRIANLYYIPNKLAIKIVASGMEKVHRIVGKY